MGEGDVLTYAALDRRSDALAQRLYDFGLRFGDHIAILMENRVEYPIAMWAAQRSGLITTPINWHLAADEAAYVVDNCGARVVIASDSQLALLDQVKPLAPNVELWLIAGNAVDGYAPMEVPVASTGPRYEPL